MYNIKGKHLAKVIILLCFVVVQAEEQIVKMYNNQNIGDVTLSKQTMFADVRGVGTTYYINVPEDAKYYVSAVTNGVEGKEYQVIVDNNNFVVGTIKLKNGWSAGFMVDRTGVTKTILLSSGDHKISFTGKGPEVPFIERIRIAENDSALSAIDFITYSKVLSEKTMPSNYLELKKNGTANLSKAFGTNTVSDPLNEYYGQLDVPINYTTNGTLYLIAGTQAVFQTSGSTTDPVMYVFTYPNLQQFSSCNDDYTGYESRISFTAPSTCYYFVVLRSYYYNQTGSTTVLYNGSSWMTSAPIGGTMVYIDYPAVSGEVNYFTAKPGSNWFDTKMWTIPGWLSPVNGFNDDYYGSFGYLSRIKLNNVEAVYCLISAGFPSGSTCDFYAKCGFNDQLQNIFPNLNNDDAINASSFGNYNCIAWSGGITGGGITSEWIWPHNDQRWYQDGNSVLQSFDNYYNNYPNLRYGNAINYPSRVDPSTPGVEIDLWATGTNPNYTYQHASVTKPGNNQMHGYGWESKPGSYFRTFHPRYSLNGSSYGEIVYSYKRESMMSEAISQGQIVRMNGVSLTQKAMALGITRPLSLDSSIALGLTVMRNVVFSEVENNKNSALISKIPDSLKNEFISKMNAWQKTWFDPQIAILSNPREYAKSKEYAALKMFCEKKGETVWPLLFAKAQENAPFIPLLLEDVLLNYTKEEMNDVNVTLGGNQFTPDGTFIYTSNKDRWVALCKKILLRF